MNRGLVLGLAVVAAAACGGDDGTGPGPATGIRIVSGDQQEGLAGSVLSAPLVVVVLEQGAPVEGVAVGWSVVEGGGSVGAASTLTDAAGRAMVTATLGAGGYGSNRYRAEVSGEGSVTFGAHAFLRFGIAGGGNNVPERYTSDLWLHGDYGYTGGWGARAEDGNAIKVWSLDPSGAPTLARTVVVPGFLTLSDLQVSPDGAWLIVSGESGAGGGAGLHSYSLADPAVPAPVDVHPVAAGYHTVSLGVVDGVLYAFGAKNPSNSALVIHRIETDGRISDPVATVPIPDDYSIHDTFVRDGLVFVSAWNTGLIIYDVGDGRAGGTVSVPKEVGRVVTTSSILSGAHVHNAWWFHNPVRNEKRYVFVGEEGPGSAGGASSGDMHVVDVSNMAAPVEVAFLHIEGAGAHNFWMDEAAQVLYMAFYNAGVVALDVSGTLAGDLSDRVIARIQPGGPGNTYTWGVMLHRGSLYASDMLSGFWQLTPP